MNIAVEDNGLGMQTAKTHTPKLTQKQIRHKRRDRQSVWLTSVLCDDRYMGDKYDIVRYGL